MLFFLQSAAPGSSASLGAEQLLLSNAADLIVLYQRREAAWRLRHDLVEATAHSSALALADANRLLSAHRHASVESASALYNLSTRQLSALTNQVTNERSLANLRLREVE
ncbi:unnamed protein product [Protopolystoma xenopodis]|uniref:Uncharacterized protein n=1 Tax=Protopolystoma xenopodis TaxID=117903 RepID=A0A448WE42_9PLAT|nr:unnamed protein product [Protopolystoma xenopodis]